MLLEQILALGRRHLRQRARVHAMRGAILGLRRYQSPRLEIRR
jgi:ribosomal protein S14